MLTARGCVMRKQVKHQDYRVNSMMKGILIGVFSLYFVCSGYAEVISESRTIKVHAKVEPIFLVEVAARTGENIIEFGAVQRAGDETVETKPVQVDIAVVSNLGVPYQITQQMTHPLTNEEGTILSKENFRVQTEQAVYGKGKIPAPEAIVSEDQLLFESSPQGVSDRFTASYWLKIPPTQPGGEYQTNIVYTIATKE